MSNLKIKRIYDPVEESDGMRVLIDRIWPRGVSKEKAALAHWLKTIAPSAELRKWFAHDPDKFETFQERYMEELRNSPETKKAVAQLETWMHEGDITLLYSAADERHNQAVVLKDFIDATTGKNRQE